MGEMADWILDNIDFDSDNPVEEISKTCYYCGKIGLHWVSTPAGWRLADDKQRTHRCTVYEQLNYKRWAK